MSRDNIQQQLKREVADLQNQIYDLETFYLQNTRDSGNLIKGFDNYLNAKAPRNQMMKKPKIQHAQRLFSLSSARSKTSEAVEEMMMGTDIRMESSQINHKRSRSRGMSANKGKSLNNDGQQDQMSMSMQNMYSMDESSNNNKGQRRKHKKIGKPAKGPRRV